MTLAGPSGRRRVGRHPLARRWAAWLAGVVALSGCAEWLEVDAPGPGMASTPVKESLQVEAPPMPVAHPEPGGDGPIAPGTPGYRVPDAGYWTRVRLETLDLLLPYTQVIVHRQGEKAFLRLEAADGEPFTGPALRGVVAIAFPSGAATEDLAGVTLSGASLAGSVVSVRTAGGDHWLVDLQAMTLETVLPDLIVGVLEGEARRGVGGQRLRHVEVGFVATRLPEPGQRP
jgi:hypothetical protein